MTFGENVRALRQEREMSQQRLAELSELSLRSIQNYESGERQPNNLAIVKKIASALGTTYDVLLSEREQIYAETAEAGGVQAARDLDGILGDLNAMFAGGTLSDDDKDKVMRAVSEMYWIAKANNKKTKK